MGSSMGAWILLREASWNECFAFMTLVAPVARWELLLFQPEMYSLRTRLLEQGLSAERAVRSHRALDPTPARPKLEPGRISVHYGRFDRVAPAVLEWAERWGGGGGLLPVKKRGEHTPDRPSRASLLARAEQAPRAADCAGPQPDSRLLAHRPADRPEPRRQA